MILLILANILICIFIKAVDVKHIWWIGLLFCCFGIYTIPGVIVGMIMGYGKI